jgi:hypothetical protein
VHCTASLLQTLIVLALAGVALSQAWRRRGSARPAAVVAEVAAAVGAAVAAVVATLERPRIPMRHRRRRVVVAEAAPTPRAPAPIA